MLLLLLGLSTLQAILIYHGKSTLNYATFEAARTGAVNHAQEGAMRHELGIRLAPLQGGDGSTERAATAILKARTFVENRLQTRTGSSTRQLRRSLTGALMTRTRASISSRTVICVISPMVWAVSRG